MPSSHPLIVIQSICTSWTKASRGGDNASARNRTPEALELPSLVVPSSENIFLLHEVMYSEHHHFQQSIQRFEQREQINPFRYNCLKLVFIENALHVKMEWERSQGAPRRVSFLKEGFSLHKAQWGRVTYNVRFSSGGCWQYRKYVINIVYVSTLSTMLFLETEPAHNYVNMANLW